MDKLFLTIQLSDNFNVDPHVAKRFNMEANFVSRLYSRFISKLKIHHLRRITIELLDFPYPTRIISHNKNTLVCLIYKYWGMGDYTKEIDVSKRYLIILNGIINTLSEVCGELEWDYSFFYNAYKETIEANFINRFILIKPKSSPNKIFTASVEIEILKEFSISYLILSKKKLKEKRIEITKVAFFINDFSDIIDKIRWVDEEEVLLSNKEEEINFRISIHKLSSEIILTPRIHSEEYLKDEIIKINPETSEEERLAIFDRQIRRLSTHAD